MNPLERLLGQFGERKWYDEFGVAHDFDPDALEAMLADPERKSLGCTRFPDGRGVSTVALGINFNHMGDPPLMFETAHLQDDRFVDVLERYPTRTSAEAGHKVWLKRFEAGYPDGPADTSLPDRMI